MRGIDKPQEVFGLDEREPALPTGPVTGLTKAADWPCPLLAHRGGSIPEVTEAVLLEDEMIRV
jgi:hypothetical protein